MSEIKEVFVLERDRAELINTLINDMLLNYEVKLNDSKSIINVKNALQGLTSDTLTTVEVFEVITSNGVIVMGDDYIVGTFKRFHIDDFLTLFNNINNDIKIKTKGERIVKFYSHLTSTIKKRNEVELSIVMEENKINYYDVIDDTIESTLHNIFTNATLEEYDASVKKELISLLFNKLLVLLDEKKGVPVSFLEMIEVLKSDNVDYKFEEYYDFDKLREEVDLLNKKISNTSTNIGKFSVNPEAFKKAIEKQEELEKIKLAKIKERKEK